MSRRALRRSASSTARSRCASLSLAAKLSLLLLLLWLLSCRDAPQAPVDEAQRLGAKGGSSPAALATSPAPSAAVATERVEVVAQAMGTQVKLAAYPSAELDAAATRRVLAAGLLEIRRIEGLMTTWRADSEVSQINRAAGRQAVRASTDTSAVIAKSLWIGELSEGAFDITFASMGKLWRFDGQPPELPDAGLIAAARRRIDFRKIRLDREERTVMLTDPESRIDLGGIAKGYAVDRASEVLRRRGLRSYCVQAGGDLLVRGRKPSGEPWRVGIRDPRGAEGAYFATVAVEDHAFSTAGDYERAFIHEGKRYHHIIDPRTGYPATESRSVTVWAADALTADALDTAVFILGPRRGLQLIESVAGCGAVIVDRHNQVWISSRLQGKVKVLRQPTDGI